MPCYLPLHISFYCCKYLGNSKIGILLLLAFGLSIASFGQGATPNALEIWRTTADSLHTQGNKRFNSDKEKARSFYHQSIQYRKTSLESHNDSFNLWRSYYNIGKIFLIESRLNQAKKYLDTALSIAVPYSCLLYTSPSPRDLSTSRMPSSA